jgi:cytochrome c oxidase assembly factor CtaG
MPHRFVRSTLGRFLRWQPLQKLGHTLTHPAICWLSAIGALVAWHVPAMFELGLHSELWHKIEHASFFATGLLFWWPVVQPWPSIARWPRWRIPLYLFMATLPCDVLSAFLAFCDRVVYPSYLTLPQAFSLSPLKDQECAGALMWTCATFIYLIPAVVITTQILSPAGSKGDRQAEFAERFPSSAERSPTSAGRSRSSAGRFPSSTEEGARGWCPQRELGFTSPLGGEPSGRTLNPPQQRTGALDPAEAEVVR